MAFTGRFGSLIRHSMFQVHLSNGKALVTSSMLNAIRCMSSSKLFIGGFSSGTDDHSLKEAFTSFGDVAEGFSSGTDDHSLKEAFTSFGDVAEDILRIMIFPLVGAKSLAGSFSYFGRHGFYVRHTPNSPGLAKKGSAPSYVQAIYC